MSGLYRVVSIEFEGEQSIDIELPGEPVLVSGHIAGWEGTKTTCVAILVKLSGCGVTNINTKCPKCGALLEAVDDSDHFSATCQNDLCCYVTTARDFFMRCVGGSSIGSSCPSKLEGDEQTDYECPKSKDGHGHCRCWDDETGPCCWCGRDG